MPDQFQLPSGLTAVTPETAPTTSNSSDSQFSLPPGLTAVDQQTVSPEPLSIGGVASEFGNQAWDAGKSLLKSLVPGSPEQKAAVEGTVSGIWHSLPPVQLADSIKQTLPIIDTYEKARSSGASIPDAIQATNTVARQHMANSDAIGKATDAYRANPNHETAKVLLGAATLAASVFGGNALGEAAAPAEAEAAGSPSLLQRVNPFRNPVAAGEAVSQPAASQAIRTGVQAAAENAGTANESLVANIQNQPLLSRGQTIIDEHLNSLRGSEQDAYDRMDEAAGFDVKAEKSQLANDQYKLKQLGNTDADLAQKDKLNASIADSQARIADAQTKMTDAGIDPTEADTIHRQRMAGTDLRKALVNATSSDGQTVNINTLLNSTKKLQFTKYGNRLQQVFGSPEAADNFLTGLEQAQKSGLKAMSRQELVNSIGKWVGIGTGATVGGGVVGGAVKHFME